MYILNKTESAIFIFYFVSFGCSRGIDFYQYFYNFLLTLHIATNLTSASSKQLTFHCRLHTQTSNATQALCIPTVIHETHSFLSVNSCYLCYRHSKKRRQSASRTTSFLPDILYTSCRIHESLRPAWDRSYFWPYPISTELFLHIPCNILQAQLVSLSPSHLQKPQQLFNFIRWSKRWKQVLYQEGRWLRVAALISSTPRWTFMMCISFHPLHSEKVMEQPPPTEKIDLLEMQAQLSRSYLIARPHVKTLQAHSSPKPILKEDIYW